MCTTRIARFSCAGELLACAALLLPGCIGPLGPPPTVWVVSGDRSVTRDSDPSAENEVYSASRHMVQLTAAVNETLALQVVLRGRNGDGPYSLAVSDLTGRSGAIPSTATTRLFHAQFVRVEHFRSWYPQYTGQSAVAIDVADMLVPWEAPHGGGPLTLAGGGNEIIWVDVHVPPGTEPGSYSGELTLRRGKENAPLFRCAVQLRVLPVTLPSRPDLPVICRVDPRDLLTEHLRWPRDGAEETRLLPEAPTHQTAIRLVDAAMRQFHDHGATPVLWTAFPKFRPVGEREIEFDWASYDALVERWIDGQAFADRVPAVAWPLPASLDYPNSDKNGGFESPQYARLLTTYLSACTQHFEERGWLDRAFVRLSPPAPLTQSSIDRGRRAVGILRQGENTVPLVAHLPAGSLRGLGWWNAPTAEPPDVNVFAPPAMWFEPEAMRSAVGLGRQMWFMPDQPPYSVSLAVEAPANDARLLPWQAYRYDTAAIWLERPADCGSPRAGGANRASEQALLYAGANFGLADQPVPSARLKRLRRGLQDYALLKLAERAGKQRLAQTVAERVMRYAFTDACTDNLLTTQEAGWPDDPTVPTLARELLLHELANELEPAADAPPPQIANLAGWSRIMNQPALVRAEATGVRLAPVREGLQAHAFMSVSNTSDRPVAGSWQLPAAPVGWSPTHEVPMSIPAGGRRVGTVEIGLSGLAYNADGIYPFNLQLDTDALGAFVVPARLAVAACPLVDSAPSIDGELSDWPRTASNSAGDFRLCRGGSAALSPARSDVPALPTQAYFCADRERVYIAVRCELRGGERPLWSADNIIPVDGAIPWGQDLVEVLINPVNAQQGTSGDLFCLQVKPSGLLVARKGARTDPPMGPSEEWQSGATVNVRIEREAWSVEIALPIDALGREARQGRIWGINVTRLDARRGEYSSWSGARGHCYAPQRLGNLFLVRP